MEGPEILKRSSLLSLLLVATILVIGIQVYSLWQVGPWDLPQPGKGKETPSAPEPKREAIQPQLASTGNIVAKNLFDPERGAGQARESESSSLALQRIRNFALLGTAILGSSRYAILQEPRDSRGSGPRVQGKEQDQLRVKLGDTLEGYELAEVSDKKVVFTKAGSRVELMLDFFRKVEEVQEKAPTPAQVTPRVVPNIPRRVSPIRPPVGP